MLFKNAKNYFQMNMQESFISREKKAAFTMIEVMVVVCIIAILVAISIGGYRSYIRRERVREAKETIEIIASCARTSFVRSGKVSNTNLNSIDAINQRYSLNIITSRDTFSIFDFKLILDPANPDTHCRINATVQQNAKASYVTPGEYIVYDLDMNATAATQSPWSGTLTMP